MQRIWLISLVLFLLPIVVKASSTATIGTTSCSGVESFSLSDMASFSCAGDYSMLNGSITSDYKIVISSDGSLTLGNVLITASRIELTSLNGNVGIGPGTSLNSDYIFINDSKLFNSTPILDGRGPDPSRTIGNGIVVNLNSGGDITLGSGNSNNFGNGTVGNINSGGNINLGSGNINNSGIIVLPPSLTLQAPVPLPASFIFMLPGIFTLWFRNRKRV